MMVHCTNPLQRLSLESRHSLQTMRPFRSSGVGHRNTLNSVNPRVSDTENSSVSSSSVIDTAVVKDESMPKLVELAVYGIPLLYDEIMHSSVAVVSVKGSATGQTRALGSASSCASRGKVWKSMSPGRKPLSALVFTRIPAGIESTPSV